MKKKQPKACKGCHSFHPALVGCPAVNGTAICPCSECLIKSMCQESCDRFRVFSDTALRLNEEGLTPKEIEKRMSGRR